MKRKSPFPYQFKRPTTVPPGEEYFWVDEPNKEEFRTGSRAELLQKIELYRKQNNLDPIPNLEFLVEDYMCRHLPEGFCDGPPMPRTADQCLVSWKMIWEGTQVILNLWKKKEQGYVSQREAERRAVICVQCPLNQYSPACVSCHGLYDLLKRWMSRRPATTVDTRLHVCSACCCLLRAKVHVSMDVLSMTKNHPYFTGDEKNPRCWMLDETITQA